MSGVVDHFIKGSWACLLGPPGNLRAVISFLFPIFFFFCLVLLLFLSCPFSALSSCFFCLVLFMLFIV